MGKEGTFLDLNPKWGGFDLVNDEVPVSSDLIIWHPPYWDMIKYSGSEWGQQNPNDLSQIECWDDFIKKINLCTAKLITALRKNGRLAILVGDIKKKGKLYSMLKSMDWYGTPENVIPKFQHGAMSFKKNYGNSKFIPTTCEYLLILKREDCYMLPILTFRGFNFDLRKGTKITWRDVVHAAMEKYGGKASLEDLYKEIEGHAKTKANEHWKEKVRQTLQLCKDFVSVKRGEWGFDY
jgi:hypothetical protein